MIAAINRELQTSVAHHTQRGPAGAGQALCAHHLHSDQGVQYVALLEGTERRLAWPLWDARQRMPMPSGSSTPWEDEEVYLNDYEDHDDAYHRIGHFLDELYATKRVHSALGYLTPAEFEVLHAAQQLA